MSDAIIVIATFTPHAGRQEDLIAALRATVPAIHQEDGCLLYSVNRGRDGSVVQIEKWANRELLDQHSAGEPVAALKRAIAPLLARPQELAVLTAVPVGDPNKGAL
ncbi:putative quinol monooxygenase [Leifsonia sp. NPDC058194]|uniref:putative quinol monooxygenase n=1 Tax=Leifsonia sp. NPDC058194 TaxID=3346374 RepID=UPI0036DCE6B9